MKFGFHLIKLTLVDLCRVELRVYYRPNSRDKLKHDLYFTLMMPVVFVAGAIYLFVLADLIPLIRVHQVFLFIWQFTGAAVLGLLMIYYSYSYPYTAGHGTIFLGSLYVVVQAGINDPNSF